MPEEKYKNHWKEGVYKCSKCQQPLFNSKDKFDSGTAWPSFRKDLNSTSTKPDNSLGMKRTELLCKKCNQHLGHVFDDGELTDNHKEAGQRFCILSEVLEFDSN